jgi:hypothetical protein
MDYAANGLSAGNQKQQYSGGALGAATAVVQPHSISSALGRLDGLNERLDSLRMLANGLADQIGGPRPANNLNKAVSGQEAVGAVSRLNNAAETAHSSVADIEETLKSIGRALG